MPSAAEEVTIEASPRPGMRAAYQLRTTATLSGPGVDSLPAAQRTATASLRYVLEVSRVEGDTFDVRVAEGDVPGIVSARFSREWTALRFGIDLADHRAHRMNEADAGWADVILGMEGHHVATVQREWPSARRKALLLGDFLPQPPFRIDDPWGREDAYFEMTFDRIGLAVDRLAQRLAKASA